MKSNMTIDYDGSKFNITCPMWANELVRNLPSRRWSKSKRAWQVPLLRQTVTGIRELVGLEGVAATDAAKLALTNYEEKSMPVPQSEGFPSWFPFKRKPRAHQLRVLNKKYGIKTFALHHDMGTGKTFTEICYACALRMEGKISAMLVIVKLSARKTWQEQFAEHAAIPYDMVLPVTEKKMEFERWLRRPHDFKVMVVGTESLSQGGMIKMVQQFVAAFVGVFAVVDESSLITNHKSIRSQHLYSLRESCDYRDTMTGTPLNKSPLDLFAQFEWLDPEIIGIGDFYAFRNRYATVIEKETKTGQKFPLVIGYQNMDELARLLAPYTDEVRKSDVLELPPKNYLPHLHVQMTKEQAALYKQVKDDGVYALKGKDDVIVKHILEIQLRLHQIAQGWMPTYEEQPYIGKKGDDRIKKIATWHPIIPPKRNPKIMELVDVCAADRQFIIWCSYRVVLEAIVQMLADTS